MIYFLQGQTHELSLHILFLLADLTSFYLINFIALL